MNIDYFSVCMKRLQNKQVFCLIELCNPCRPISNEHDCLRVGGQKKPSGTTGWGGTDRLHPAPSPKYPARWGGGLLFTRSMANSNSDQIGAVCITARSPDFTATMRSSDSNARGLRNATEGVGEELTRGLPLCTYRKENKKDSSLKLQNNSDTLQICHGASGDVLNPAL